MSKKWEYRREPVPDPMYAMKTLNSIGDDGWELVAIVENAFYFKREKVEARDAPGVKQYPPRERQGGHPVG